MWFQNARAKYRRNTLKQEQQERNGNSGGSVHQVTAGDGAAVGDHAAAATSPPRGQRASQRGPSRSPASLSDLSSTPSTTNDVQPSSISAAVASGQTGLIMMDFERRQTAMVDSMPMFGNPGFLVDNC